MDEDVNWKSKLMALPLLVYMGLAFMVCIILTLIIFGVCLVEVFIPTKVSAKMLNVVEYIVNKHIQGR